MAITPLTTDLNNIQNLADQPNATSGLTPTQVKVAFDAAGNAIKAYINNTLIPGIAIEIDAQIATSPRYEIINGNFDRWERGTSFTLGSSGGYTSDRWKFVRSGAGTTTITQDPSVPNGKSKYSLRCGGSYLAGEFEDKKYHIESIDASKLSGQEVTISAQHKDAVSAGSNTLQILVHYASAADNFATVEAVGFSAQLPLTPEYSLASLTLTLPATSPVGGYPIGNGIQIVFRHVQAGATGALITFLSQVQVDIGDTALPFRTANISQVAVACLRYFRRSGYGNFGHWISATQCETFGEFNIPMRVAPTITLNKANAIVTELGVGNKTASGGTIFYTNTSTTGYGIALNGFSGATTGNLASVADNPFDFDAEI